MKAESGARVSLVLFILGVVLMISGIAGGELLTIMSKAILVCLECIGIG